MIKVSAVKEDRMKSKKELGTYADTGLLCLQYLSGIDIRE